MFPNHTLRTVAIAFGFALLAVCICFVDSRLAPYVGLFGMAVTASQFMEMTANTTRSYGPAAASTTLYGGTFGFTNSGGYVDDDTAAGANTFAGVIVETVANTGSNGDVDVEYYSNGRFLVTGSGFVQADVGSKCYASDNFTATKTSTGNTYIGTIKEFKSATEVWVDLDPHTP